MEFNNDKNNRDMNETKENGFHLFPVSAHASGEGLPYAPVDWPQPGDTWCWKVGNRVAASGFFLDRYLYLPKRLQIKSKRRTFASKLSVEQYLVCTFPDEDVEAFFASFSWKVPSLNPSEIKGLETRPATPTRRCKAGNEFCASLVKSEERISQAMFCDICCSEHGFCRDCCCILCCKTINTADGDYSFIVCEAAVDEGGICEHIAHVECGLKCCLAGTIGESGLDAEYYCRRCDARTDLISHVTKFLQSCESIDSRDEIENILNLGALILRGSSRTSAKRLLRKFELAKAKLECKTCLKKVLKKEDHSPFTPVVRFHGDASECMINERLDIRPGSAQKVSEIFNPTIESLKLELQVDQAMLGLRKSQESEYSIAQQKLYAQARCLQNLYRQLEREKGELALHMANGGDTDALHQRVKTTETHIKKEKIKLKEMQLVGNGFGATPEEVMKEHFGLGVSLSHG